MLQNEESSQQATSNANELPRLQANLMEEPNVHSTTNENEETNTQNVADGSKELSPKVISN